MTKVHTTLFISIFVILTIIQILFPQDVQAGDGSLNACCANPGDATCQSDYECISLGSSASACTPSESRCLDCGESGENCCPSGPECLSSELTCYTTTCVPTIGVGDCVPIGGICPNGTVPVYDEDCPNTETRCAAPSADNPDFSIPTYGSYGYVPGGFNFPIRVDKIGNIFTDLLPYIFVIAGLLLLAYLLYGGFHLATSFGSPKAILEAWTIIFRALVGFILVFGVFWLMKLLETILGLCILGNCT